MAKLWCFGDSFTAGDGCAKTSEHPITYTPQGYVYREYLGKNENENILLFSDIVANHFGLDNINLGQSGAGNEKILDSILSNIHLISKEDYVIFGVSYFQRFDIDGDNPKDFSTINVNSLLDNPTNNDMVTDTLSRVGLMQIVINRASKKFENRLLRQVNGMTHILKQLSKNVYVWTNDHYLDEQHTKLFKLVDGYHTLSHFFSENDITFHTGGLVGDGHLSEVGHARLADDIIKYFENEK